MEKMWDKMKEMAEKYPDLRDAYLSKVEMRQKFMKTVRDKGEVSKVLDDMDRTCDQFQQNFSELRNVYKNKFKNMIGTSKLRFSFR
jgi:hypothetical protein